LPANLTKQRILIRGLSNPLELYIIGIVYFGLTNQPSPLNPNKYPVYQPKQRPFFIMKKVPRRSTPNGQSQHSAVWSEFTLRNNTCMLSVSSLVPWPSSLTTEVSDSEDGDGCDGDGGTSETWRARAAEGTETIGFTAVVVHP
jgi:hypothetical protein